MLVVRGESGKNLKDTAETSRKMRNGKKKKKVNKCINKKSRKWPSLEEFQ